MSNRPLTPEDIEEFASDGWDAFYQGKTNPLWSQLSGAAKGKQLELAANVAKYGSSAGQPLESAYAKAFRDWEAAHPLPDPGAEQEKIKPAKTTKK